MEYSSESSEYTPVWASDSSVPYSSRSRSAQNPILSTSSASTRHWKEWKTRKPRHVSRLARLVSYGTWNPAKLAMRVVKTSADMVREGSKAVVRESFTHWAKFVHASSALALEYLHDSGYYHSGTQRLVSKKPNRKRKKSMNDIKLDAKTGRINKIIKRLVDGPTHLASRTFRLILPASEPSSDTRVNLPSLSLFTVHGFKATGFLEDLELMLLTWIDESYDFSMVTAQQILTRVDYLIQGLLFRVPFPSIKPITRDSMDRFIVRALEASLQKTRNLYEPVYQLVYGGVDDRAFHDFVMSIGYPYENFESATEDGHLLSLERISRPGAHKVVYFQHGVLDTAYAWISSCSGAGASNCAFAAFNCGYDVFLGNFRGSRDRKHVNPGVSSKDYWDFSLNEHAMMDTVAFIDKIREIKRKEGITDTLEITLIGHSLGGATSMMYLVESLRRKQSHHLKQMILLSPAGYHKAIPTMCKYSGPVLYPLSYLFYGFRLPAGIVIFVITKFLQDLRNMPAARDLVSFLYTKFLIGGTVEKSAFSQISNFSFNLLLGGTSAKVFRHFWQLYASGKFQLYDYGPTKNKQVYGDEFSDPPALFDFYNLIDIPVHFACGEDDKLIPPTDVTAHFECLRQSHPELSHFKCFYSSNHINFTYGQDDRIISFITKHL